MNWTTPNDIKERIMRLWNEGDLLKSLVTGEPAFPIQIKLRGPSPSELPSSFEAARSWIDKLINVPHIQLEWRAVNNRVVSSQKLPHIARIETPDDALALINRRIEADQFKRMFALTREQLPSLTEWLARRPMRALELFEQWPQLLAVVRWMITHPRPGIYLRQADIPGVHTKFIEHHRTVLIELLDLILPPEMIDQEKSGSQQFAARYGFLGKPARIRFRVLDERIGPLPGALDADITLDAQSFARLPIPATRVFITENETNFLAFPRVEGAIVIFGAGYGCDALARATWLHRCEIHYWGDIDTHGFAILDQLRRHFSHVTSFLMDRATLMAHEASWGTESDPIHHDLTTLSDSERAVYDLLRDNRIRNGLRLEQEQVAFGWLTDALARTIQSSRQPDPRRE